jgi:hypothetical protein
MIIYFLCHDDEIILIFSSYLNKQLANQQRDKSMGPTHIFLPTNGDYLHSTTNLLVLE